MLDNPNLNLHNFSLKMKDHTPNKVIFVCSGNICRSPMGEGLLKHAIAATPQDDPVRKLDVCSAGVSTVDGLPPSAHSVSAMKEVGVDISSYRSTALTQDLIDQAFAIFAMDETHIDVMRRYFKNLPKRTFKVLDMSEMSRKIVFDPYGGDLDEYRECRDDIVTSIAGILKYLQNETKN